MPRFETSALVLDVMEYRETSSLIRILTPNDGRLSLIGKGLRKPKGGAAPGAAIMQPFNQLQVQYVIKDGSSLGNLVQADLEKSWNGPRQNLETYALAAYWFEILKECSQPGESAQGIFDQTCRFMDNQENDPGLTLRFLRDVSELCQVLGFGLHWNECSICGEEKNDAEHFSLKSGVVCFQCVSNGREGIPLKPAEKLLIRQLVDLKTDNIDNQQAAMKDFLSLVNRFLAYHLEKPLGTFSFVQSTVF